MAQYRNTITTHNITDQAAFESIISRAFDELRQQFFDRFTALAFNNAPHAYFKRLGDTARLMQTVWINHFNLAQNPAVIAKQQQQQANDPHNQNLFSYLAGHAKSQQGQNVQPANQQTQPT